MIVDADSKLRIESGKPAVLLKSFTGFDPGHEFDVLQIIECSGGDYLRYNAKVVERGQPKDDSFFHRTIPAEHLERQWVVGECFDDHINQAYRTCKVLAVLGLDVLVDYEMPGGRTFLRIYSRGQGRPVSLKALPAKWLKALEVQ